LALVATALADRPAFVEARDTLAKAYFDELDPNERDKLFTKIGTWDNPDAVGPFADVVSRFGTYLDGLEGQIQSTQKKLDPLKRRRGLSEAEIKERDGFTKELERVEALFRRARASEDVLVRMLGGWSDPRTIQSALAYERHASTAVRHVFARACGQWHALQRDDKVSSKALAALKRLQKDADPTVRTGVARALGAFHRPEAVDLLTAASKDPDWRVRAAVVRSLASARSPEAVTLLIDMMKREEGRLRDDINMTLRALTGEDMGFAETWAQWWNDVGRQLPTRAAAAPDGDTSLKAIDTAQFYGIPTRSKRLCFIIDVSGSMDAEVEQIQEKKAAVTGRKESELPVEGKTRLEVAKNELKRAVSNLAADTLFSVIFFNQAVRTWHPAMEKATAEIKEALRKDLDIVAASGTTYTMGALREAFALAGVQAAGGQPHPKGEIAVDTIFVLSDGGPTDNKMEDAQPMDPEIILESVRQWNRDAGIVIHAIAVDTEEVGTYFLKQLAAQNGGRFVERRK
jgi:Mg-chelatase subunit ChlD